MFAGWVSGLILFSLVGAVVALVSLSRPEHDSFDSRARILFRRQTGPHIDHIVSRISETLEHYAENTRRKVVVREYDQDSGKYFLSIETETIVRSYIDDITSSYTATVQFSNASLAPAGRPQHRLVYLRMNGVPYGTGEEFGEGITRDFVTTIPPDAFCKVEQLVEVSVRANDEPNTHKPIRYTQKFALELENQLINGQAVQVNFSHDEGVSWQQYQVAAGDKKIILERREIPPDKVIYDFRLLAP